MARDVNFIDWFDKSPDWWLDQPKEKPKELDSWKPFDWWDDQSELRKELMVNKQTVPWKLHIENDD